MQHVYTCSVRFPDCDLEIVGSDKEDVLARVKAHIAAEHTIGGIDHPSDEEILAMIEEREE
jgi:predicted small metal-binding protein